MSPRPSMHRLAAACLAVASLAGAVVMPSVAAARQPVASPAEVIPITVSLSIGGSAISGTAPSGPITITAHRKNLKDVSVKVTSYSGNFLTTYLPRPFLVGDTVRIVAGDTTRAIAIPKLDGFIDRVAGTLSGHAGAGTLIPNLYLCHGGGCSMPTIGAIPVNPDGTYLVDLSLYRDGDHHWGEGAGASVDLELQRASGDVFHRGTAAAAVRAPGLKRTTVEVRAARTGPVKVSVRDSLGALRGTGAGTVVADGGFHALTIRQADGRAVRLRPGDKVSVSVAKGTVFELPASLSVTGTATEDIIRATCPGDALYQYQLLGGPKDKSGSGVTDVTGAVEITGLDLLAGEQMIVTCSTPDLDQITLRGVVS
ncbi:MAG: hypothetical protein U0869_22915 [Chloroflexota bacterium]